APSRLPTTHVAAHTTKACATVIRAWSGSTRVGETWAPGIGSQITPASAATAAVLARSAGESRGGREHEHAPAATVLETPSVRHRQPGRVTFTEVVIVRVATGGEILEPDDRAPVLVRQRGRGRLGTTAS